VQTKARMLTEPTLQRRYGQRPHAGVMVGAFS
jgi:hypothetical protein